MNRREAPWWRQAGREFVCWCLGHAWKHSWRSRDDRAEREARTLSYREEREGNPYYWYSAGWRAKCRRCRLRTRGNEPWHPWYRRAWWAVRSPLQHGWWLVDFYVGDTLRKPVEGRGYSRLPVRYWPVALLHAATAIVAYGVLHLEMDFRLPLRWLEGLALDADFALGLWLDRRLKSFRWTPPRPDVAGSIGFWQNAETYNPEMSIIAHEWPGGAGGA